MDGLEQDRQHHQLPLRPHNPRLWRDDGQRQQCHLRPWLECHHHSHQQLLHYSPRHRAGQAGSQHHGGRERHRGECRNARDHLHHQRHHQQRHRHQIQQCALRRRKRQCEPHTLKYPALRLRLQQLYRKSRRSHTCRQRQSLHADHARCRCDRQRRQPCVLAPRLQ